MGWLVCPFMYSQSQLKVFQDWSTTVGTQNFFQKSVTKTDASGNVYVAGATKNASGNYDMLLAKYNSSGVQQWIAQYNGAANYHDAATGLYIDGSGNVYITGFAVNDTATLTSDIITIKYNSSGTQQWAATYNGSGSSYDSGADIVVDGSGNVYITGSAYNTVPNTDAVTIKYNSSGTQQWIVVYNGTSNDAGVKISLSGTTVTITAAVQVSSTNYRHRTFDYTTSAGTLLGGTISSSTSVTQGEATDIFRDALGNVYLTGGVAVTGQGYNISTIKFDSTMALVWQRSYNGGSNLDDFGNALQVDASGNVYVTGYTTDTTGDLNFITVKYNSSGTQQWASIYNDSLNGKDEGRGIVLDNSGNVYVTGSAQTDAINGLNFYTIKYNSSGTEIWSIDADGNKHLEDKATNIAIDNSGDIVVTGQSEVSDTVYEYKTIKYVEKNVITPTDYNSETPTESFTYYENRGQLLNTNDSLVPDVRYYTNNTLPTCFIQDRSLSYVFAHIDTAVATSDTMHRIDLSFTGGHVSRTAKVYPLEKQAHYLNYFLAHIPDGVTEIHGNNKLITPDLFPNIDLQYSSNQNGFKYYFIVKPGGDPDHIQMEFTGASSFSLDTTSNKLTVNSSVGSITFDRPTVYQLNSSNVIVPVTGWTADWQTNGASNKYKFNSGTYDSTKTLVIQIDQGNGSASPTSSGNLNWSTYYGGGLDELLDIKTDATGKIYVTGYSPSSAFPTTTGVVSPTHPGTDEDVVIIKFQGNGSRQWATFYGGTNDERGNAITTDAIGNVYVTGYTESGNFPTQSPSGEFLDATNGCTGTGCTPWDLFIVRLNPNGTAFQRWATFYGGNGNGSERGLDIAIDGNNNLFVVGSGTSNTPLVSSGSFNNTSGGGLIMEFNSSRSLTWATFTGGTAAGNWVQGIDFDNSNNIYITGWARSSGYPILNPGANGTFGGGNFDCVLTKLKTNTHQLLWSTYLGGDGDESGEAVSVNQTSGDVFITGYTNSGSTGPIPTLDPGSGAYYQASCAGGEDIFITEFDALGVMLWSTYYGGTNDDEGEDIDISDNGNIFVVGNTYSSDLPIPMSNLSGGYNDNGLEGTEDAFLLGFNSNQQQTWATYFGGSLFEFGYGCTVYQNSSLYMTGFTLSDNTLFPLDNGGGIPYYDETLTTGGSYNGYISRFDISIIIGINDISQNNIDFQCYPNPTAKELNILFNLESKSNVTVQLIDNLGRLVTNENLGIMMGKVKKQISVNDLSDGIYFIKIVLDNNDIVTAKFIKQ